MKTNAESFTKKVALLKEARLQLLQLHKMLVDIERTNYENKNGEVTSGQFLNLLIGNAEFVWLRNFSTLIVNIDEMFDLDDGYHEGFVNKHLEAMRALISLEMEDAEFNKKFKSSLEKYPEVLTKKESIEEVLKK